LPSKFAKTSKIVVDGGQGGEVQSKLQIYKHSFPIKNLIIIFVEGNFARKRIILN